MDKFIYGMVVGLVFVLAMAIANRTTDAILLQIRNALDESDQKTLDRILHFKIHRLLEAAFILVIFFIGYGCKGLLG